MLSRKRKLTGVGSPVGSTKALRGEISPCAAKRLEIPLLGLIDLIGGTPRPLHHDIAARVVEPPVIGFLGHRRLGPAREAAQQKFAGLNAAHPLALRHAIAILWLLALVENKSRKAPGKPHSFAGQGPLQGFRALDHEASPTTSIHAPLSAVGPGACQVMR